MFCYLYSGNCQDKISNCADYTQAVCTNKDYATWVLNNCAHYCNKCGEDLFTTIYYKNFSLLEGFADDDTQTEVDYLEVTRFCLVTQKIVPTYTKQIFLS